MSDVTPWSQGLLLRWAPSVEYFERRFELVRALRDTVGIREFAVSHNSVLVRAAGARTLEVAVDHLTVEDARGDLQSDGQADSILRLVLEHLQPRVVSLQWSLQYLVELLGFSDATDACAAVTRAVHGSLADDLGLTDFAALVDGEVSDLGAYKMEFGVVPDAEAPLRLSRVIGRAVTRTIDSELGLEVNAARSFPPVGLFADVAWEVKVPPPAADLSPIERVWSSHSAVLAESSRLVQAIYDYVLPPEVEEAP